MRWRPQQQHCCERLAGVERAIDSMLREAGEELQARVRAVVPVLSEKCVAARDGRPAAVRRGLALVGPRQPCILGPMPLLSPSHEIRLVWTTSRFQSDLERHSFLPSCVRSQLWNASLATQDMEHHSSQPLCSWSCRLSRPTCCPRQRSMPLGSTQARRKPSNKAQITGAPLAVAW